MADITNELWDALQDVRRAASRGLVWAYGADNTTVDANISKEDLPRAKQAELFEALDILGIKAKRLQLDHLDQVVIADPESIQKLQDYVLKPQLSLTPEQVIALLNFQFTSEDATGVGYTFGNNTSSTLTKTLCKRALEALGADDFMVTHHTGQQPRVWLNEREIAIVNAQLPPEHILLSKPREFDPDKNFLPITLSDGSVVEKYNNSIHIRNARGEERLFEPLGLNFAHLDISSALANNEPVVPPFTNDQRLQMIAEMEALGINVKELADKQSSHLL